MHQLKWMHTLKWNLVCFLQCFSPDSPHHITCLFLKGKKKHCLFQFCIDFTLLFFLALVFLLARKCKYCVLVEIWTTNLNLNMSVAPATFSLCLLKFRIKQLVKKAVPLKDAVLRSVLTFSAVDSKGHKENKKSVVFQTGKSHGQFEEE